jgi:UDP-hydrolysing UDP-N-acetyl-D-glucosamine 2-epimerase
VVNIASRQRRGRVREIAVVTTGRADYGLLAPIVRALIDMPRVVVRLIATGAHLSRRFGLTVRQIEADGFGPILERVDLNLSDDSPKAIAAAIGRGTAGFGALFAKRRPDLLVLLGDRYETLSAASAALPFNLPIAHIHGGELTEGAIDDAIRHAISKMSHLHFVAARPYAQRLRRLGEEGWRITVSGAPGLDAVHDMERMSAAELERDLGVPIGRQTLLVTYHPETLAPGRAGADAAELLAALDRVGAPVVITSPNADPGRDPIQRAVEAFVRRAPDRVLVASLGQRRFLSLLAAVGAMVGNSSSGLIEAPSFRLPVVNIGDRQRGRLRARNVIDTAARRADIERAARRALSPRWRRSLRGLRNPYGDGSAAGRIVAVLARVPLDRRLLVKRFMDAPPR